MSFPNNVRSFCPPHIRSKWASRNRSSTISFDFNILCLWLSDRTEAATARLSPQAQSWLTGLAAFKQGQGLVGQVLGGLVRYRREPVDAGVGAEPARLALGVAAGVALHAFRGLAEGAFATEVRGHLVERMRGEWRAGILSALVGRRRRYEAAAWICPADGRLYFASVASALPEGPEEPGLVPGRLSCCAGLAFAG